MQRTQRSPGRPVATAAETCDRTELWLQALVELTAALSEATTTSEVARLAVEHGTAALDARGGWLVTAGVESGPLSTSVATGDALQLAARTPTIPIEADHPLAEAVRTRSTRGPTPPRDRPTGTTTGSAAAIGPCICLPLLRGGRCLGAVLFQLDEPASVGAGVRAMLEALVAQCAQALDWALLFEGVRKSTQRVTEANALLSAVADGMEDLLGVKDREGRYILANSAFTRAFHLDGGFALAGLRDEDLGIETPDGASDHDVTATGRPLRFEHTLNLPDGPRTYISTKSPLRGPAGETIGVIVTSTDITARKHEDELLARLQEATGALSRCVTPEQVARTTIAHASMVIRPAAAGFFLADDATRSLELVEAFGFGKELAERMPSFPIGAATPAAEAYRRGEPVWVESRARLEAEYPEAYRLFAGRGGSAFGMPLRSGDDVLGALGIVAAEESGLLARERSFLGMLGDQAATAISRAQRYELEHGIAETLQRSLLPAGLPSVSGLDVAAQYLPGGAGLAVGGDWFDAMELPDGTLAVAVGDVVGHGIEAAAVMGQMRNALRVQLLEGKGPAGALAGLNEFVHLTGVGEVATAVCVVADPSTATLRHASAGHPPPLLVPPGGDPTFLEGGRAVPLGALAAARYEEEAIPFPPGSALVLYTDGLVERRGSSIDDGFERLRAVGAVGARHDAANLVALLVDRILGSTEPTDDVAVVVMRIAPRSPDRIELDLPAEPAALATLRRGLGRLLEENGAGEDEAYDVLVSTCEAAANAIEHAYGPASGRFSVKVGVVDGRVEVRVSDSGRWRKARSPRSGYGLGMMEKLMDAVHIDRGVAGTTVRMSRTLRRGSHP